MIKGKKAVEALLNGSESQDDQIVVALKIGEAIKERGLTQKEVAEMTRIRPAAISQLARGYIERLNLDHLQRIAVALKVKDINELISLELESEVWNMNTPKEEKEILDAIDDKEGDS